MGTADTLIQQLLSTVIVVTRNRVCTVLFVFSTKEETEARRLCQSYACSGKVVVAVVMHRRSCA
jgi:hypothetical protein